MYLVNIIWISRFLNKTVLVTTVQSVLIEMLREENDST